MKMQEVNIAAGDDASEYFAKAVRTTWENRPGLVDTEGLAFGHSAMIDGAYFGDSKNILFGHQLDGIGTKVEIHERTGNHAAAALDLFAMVGDDVAPTGGELISIDNILDVRELDPDNRQISQGIKDLATGLVQAAHLSGAVAITGEIAELGSRIRGSGDFNYNWAGVAYYAVNKERRLTGRELQAGQHLVGLVEPGFRSNGITDVRNALKEAYGEDWHHEHESALSGESNLTLGQIVGAPSEIYAGLLRELQGGIDLNVEPKAEVTGVAHITGGGQPSKLGRMLARTNGLGITIDKPITPPEMILHVQRLRGFDDRTAYGKWHMGPGMVVATTEPDKVIAEADQFAIGAQVIGFIDDKPGIRIKNKGAEQNEEWLEF